MRGRKSGRRQTLAPLSCLEQPETPPEIQILNRQVARGHWRDPDDTSTATGVPREVSGWRRRCPIRRAQQQHGARSIFSELHLVASDRLRGDYDLGRLGCGGVWFDGVPVTAAMFRPTPGPSKRATRQWMAAYAFRRAWSLHDPLTQRVLDMVLLRNAPCRTAAAALDVSHSRLPELLVAALDVLVMHYNLRPRDVDAAA